MAVAPLTCGVYGRLSAIGHSHAKLERREHFTSSILDRSAEALRSKAPEALTHGDGPAPRVGRLQPREGPTQAALAPARAVEAPA